MRVVFSLSIHEPLSGGLATLVTYANGLARRGHEVTAYHVDPADRPHDPLLERHFDPSVAHRSGEAPELSDPGIDVEIVHWLPFTRAPPVFVLQGNPGPFVAGLGVPIVCVARWLVDHCREMGVPPGQTIYVPNGLRHDIFMPSTPPAERQPRIAMLVHPSWAKRSVLGFRALNRLKRRHDQVEAVLFGDRPADVAVPAWADFVGRRTPHELASEIYGTSQIFLCTSPQEGFGNTSLEAMACGCAVVTTDNGGSSEFAFDGVTALVAPRDGSAEHLATLMERLIADDDLRSRLTTAGQATAARFTWDRTIDRLEAFLDAYRSEPNAYFDRGTFERELRARLSGRFP